MAGSSSTIMHDTTNDNKQEEQLEDEGVHTNIQLSPIIREGTVLLKGSMGKKKKEHLILCRPDSPEDILSLRDRLAAIERESGLKKGSLDDVWRDGGFASPSKDKEVEAYGHLAFAAIAGHSLLILGTTTRTFIHMPNVVAIHDETVLKSACHLSVITESRHEYKLSLDTSPSYQDWMDDLLDAFDYDNYGNDAVSLRSYRSQRSQRSTIRSGRSISRHSTTSKSVRAPSENYNTGRSASRTSESNYNTGGGRSASRTSTPKSTRSVSRPNSIINTPNSRPRTPSRPGSRTSRAPSTTSARSGNRIPGEVVVTSKTASEPERLPVQAKATVVTRSSTKKAPQQLKTVAAPPSTSPPQPKKSSTVRAPPQPYGPFRLKKRATEATPIPPANAKKISMFSRRSTEGESSKAAAVSNDYSLNPSPRIEYAKEVVQVTRVEEDSMASPISHTVAMQQKVDERTLGTPNTKLSVETADLFKPDDDSAIVESNQAEDGKPLKHMDLALEPPLPQTPASPPLPTLPISLAVEKVLATASENLMGAAIAAESGQTPVLLQSSELLPSENPPTPSVSGTVSEHHSMTTTLALLETPLIVASEHVSAASIKSGQITDVLLETPLTVASEHVSTASIKSGMISNQIQVVEEKILAAASHSSTISTSEVASSETTTMVVTREIVDEKPSSRSVDDAPEVPEKAPEVPEESDMTSTIVVEAASPTIDAKANSKRSSLLLRFLPRPQKEGSESIRSTTAEHTPSPVAPSSTMVNIEQDNEEVRNRDDDDDDKPLGMLLEKEKGVAKETSEKPEELISQKVEDDVVAYVAPVVPATSSPKKVERKSLLLTRGFMTTKSPSQSKSPQPPTSSATTAESAKSPGRRFTINNLFGAGSSAKSSTSPPPPPASATQTSPSPVPATLEETEPRGRSAMKQLFKAKSKQNIKAAPEASNLGTSDADAGAPPSMSRTASSGSSRPNLLASLILVPSVRVKKVESLGAMIKKDIPDLTLSESQDSRMSRSLSQMAEDKEKAKIVDFKVEEEIVPDILVVESAGVAEEISPSGAEDKTPPPPPAQPESLTSPLSPVKIEASVPDISFDVVPDMPNLSIASIAAVNNMSFDPIDADISIPHEGQQSKANDLDDEIASDSDNSDKDDSEDEDSDDDDEIITFADKRLSATESLLSKASPLLERAISPSPPPVMARRRSEGRRTSSRLSLYSETSVDAPISDIDSRPRSALEPLSEVPAEAENSMDAEETSRQKTEIQDSGDRSSVEAVVSDVLEKPIEKTVPAVAAVKEQEAAAAAEMERQMSLPLPPAPPASPAQSTWRSFLSRKPTVPANALPSPPTSPSQTKKK